MSNKPRQGGDFGKGPALEKNESGSGYHYAEGGRISGRMIRRVGSHPGVTNVSGGEQSSSPSEMPRVRDDDDGPTREEEEGMGFERSLWIKSGPNPRRR